jgi:PAS domain S-box-containing protein
MSDEGQDRDSVRKGGPGPGSMQADLRGRAEKRLKKRGSRGNQALSPEGEQRVIHELQVHQIELEMMNEELKESSRIAEEAQVKYQALFDFAPVGYLSLGKAGMILELNLTGSLILGMPRAHIVGRRFQSFLTRESIPVFNAFAKKVLGSADKQTCELGISSNGGEGRFFRIEGIASAGENGEAQIQAAMIDITDQKRAGESLREIALRYQTVAENTYDWEFWLDPGVKFLYCSPSCERITGHQAGEFLADPGLRRSCIHPEDREAFERHEREVEREQLVGRGQWRLVRPDGTVCWVEHVCQPVYGEKEEFLGTRGSNRDITDGMEFERALRESEARFRALAEAMPQIVWSADASGAFDYYNPQALAYGGVRPDEVRGWSWESLIHPDDLPATLAAWQRALHTGEPNVIEQRLRRSDGEYRWHLSRGVPIRDDHGTVVRWIGTSTDIHDLKIAAENILRTSEWLGIAQRAAGAGFWDWDIPIGKLTWSAEFYRLFGLPRTVAASFDAWLGAVHEEDRELSMAMINESIEEKKPLENEYRIVRPGGDMRWIGAWGNTTFDEAGKPLRMSGICIDITDRKRAEDRITHLASFPELNPNPILELRPSGEVIYANPAVTRALGNMGLGDDPEAFLPADIQVLLPRLLEGDVIEEVKVGERVFLETVTLNTLARTIRIYARDITDRKKAEQALRETSEYLENLINHANAPIIVWDPAFRITRFNHAFERLTGRRPKEVIGRGLEILFPQETVEGSMDHIRRAMAGEWWEVVEIPILHRDGSVRTVLWNSATLYEADGKTVSSAIAQGQDITDRKQMEEDLRDTSQYLENLISHANAPIIVWDPAFRITGFNRAFERLTGMQAEEVIGRGLEILFPQETVEGSMDHIRRAMAGEQLEVVEIPILHRDGSVKTVLWNSATLYEADGKTVSSAIAQGQDITDRKLAELEVIRKAAELGQLNADLSAEIAHRKKAEEEVRRTLSVLNAALESTADAMLVIDRSGRITSYNQNFSTMWNIPDAVIHTLDTQASPGYLASQVKDPEGFSARMQEILDHPQRETYDMLELLDGRVIERYSKPQKVGNAIVGRVYSFRDVTDRKRAEERLITSLEEKEVLLREIHHRVKNNLQLTTSLLDMTRMRTTDPGTVGILTDVMMKIQTMAQIHTRLYESKRFDRINMSGQIRDQFRALEGIYGGRDRDITVEIESSEIYLPIDQAIPCALALNEILSNTYKHAFPDRKSGTVKFRAVEEGGRIRFTVSDDGIGLPPEFDITRANTLGLKLVRTLVEKQLRGTLSMTRGKTGTEVIVELPVRGEEGEHVKDTRG